MLSWSNCKPEISQAIRSDRLDLTDLLEKLADAGVRFSDLLRGQTFCIRVTGWSMTPALHPGDQITVEPASPVQLQVGDLLLFHERGRLICHRLVAMQETAAGPRLITKGDAAAGCGVVIHPDQVLGRVVGSRPSWHLAGSLSKRIDCWLARFSDKVAQGLLVLQGLRFYRRMMRALMSRCVAYYFEIPEVGEGFCYNRIGGRGIPELLKGHHRFHLVAKLAGICVGSLQVTASGEGYWIDDFYVRIRFRGLGVGSQLLASAATAASRSGARVLLAWVEPTNTTTLHLFTRAGFSKTGGPRGDQVSLRRDL
jgi:ribosomal protein S18 acetylase RimI-like enzyme